MAVHATSGTDSANSGAICAAAILDAIHVKTRCFVVVVNFCIRKR